MLVFTVANKIKEELDLCDYMGIKIEWKKVFSYS